MLGFLGVFLRVPPLFVMDELLRVNLGFSPILDRGVHHPDTKPLDLFATKIRRDTVDDLTITNYNVAFYMLKVMLCSGAFIASLIVFMLRTRYIAALYAYILTISIVVMSYIYNIKMLENAISISGNISMPTLILDYQRGFVDVLLTEEFVNDHVLQNIMLQFICGIIFSRFYFGPRKCFLKFFLPLCFIIPGLAVFLPISATTLCLTPTIAVAIPLMLLNNAIWNRLTVVFKIIRNGLKYAKTMTVNFGLPALIEAEWVRLKVPTVLRTFWILRILEHTFLLILDNKGYEEKYEVQLLRGFLNVSKDVLIGSSDTLIAIMGMTSIISYICHYIGNLFQFILLTDDDDDKSIGTVSAILFFILSLQTSLTSLEAEKRLIRLGRNTCLLFTALLHFIHNIVNPVLMSLSAAHNPCWKRHLRALFVCLFLTVFPTFLLTYLWRKYSLSTWLLAVTAFSIEVIVKVFVSLITYTLFLIDAYRTSFWEELDDYLYFIKAFGNTIEFCFGVFLFFNGVWILMFESGGAIRAVMVCIHAYFNIWCEAKSGWNVFMKRRTAVNKINSLPEASENQLKELDDVCAICYQEMRNAKITKCNHYFHAVCLRKWLYVQDKCPLCHEVLYHNIF